MHDLPHRYAVAASAAVEGRVTLTSPGLASLETSPPAEFGGPGDRWSPETLLVGAVVDCFVLSFRAVARASQLAWTGLEVEAEGLLDRVEGRLRFTEVRLRAQLRTPPGVDEARARRLLEKAEASCLISNSLSATVHLEATIAAG